MYTRDQYDVLCSLTSLGLGLGGIRIMQIVPPDVGRYVLASLIACMIASIAFRQMRLRKSKHTESLKQVDKALALQAFIGCSVALYPYMSKAFFIGLGSAFFMFVWAELNESLSLHLHTLGHFVLVGTLLFL